MEEFEINTIVPRSEWGALPATTSEDLSLPVTKVLFSAENEFGYCETRDDCTQMVRSVQKHYISKGLADMPYSFVVGNDGNVYEGRGWNSKPGPDIQINDDFKDNTIDIGVLCGHKEVTSDNMDLVRRAFRQAENFVKYSIKLERITKDYQFEGFSDDVKPNGWEPSDAVPPPIIPLTDRTAPSQAYLDDED